MWVEFYQINPDGEQAADRERVDRAYTMMQTIAAHKGGLRLKDFIYDPDNSLKGRTHGSSAIGRPVKQEQWDRISSRFDNWATAKG